MEKEKHLQTIYNRKMKRNRFNILIAVFIIAAIVGLALWAMLRPQQYYLQGQVEARQIHVAPKIPGRVEKICVKEGDIVKKGTLLAEIGTPEIDAKLVQAKAAKLAAMSQMQKANAGARTEQVQAAYNLWQQAKVAADLAEKTYEKVDRLFTEKVLPEQKRDEAKAKSVALREQEKAAKANYEMAKKGTRIEDKEAAKALVARAKGAVDEVESYQSERNVYAPSSGEVQSIIPEEGEIVNAGYPVVNIVDLSDVWVIFHVREDQMQHFKKNTQFEAKVPALGDENISFEVRHISVLGDFATWTATRATGDFDKKTFAIKAYPVKSEVDLRPGMSVLIDSSLIE